MKFLLIAAFILLPFNTFAGDGHDHGDSQFAGNAFANSFDLSDSAIKNLDIQTYNVNRSAFSESLTLPCFIKTPPEQTSQIHNTYIGEVKKIHARVGDRVEKGQLLFDIFSMKAVRDLPIIAPITGIVSSQNVSIGQIVQFEDTLMEITSHQFFIADGMAYLTDNISNIKVGDKAEITIDGIDNTFKGYVQGIAPSIDSITKTKSVFVDFQAPEYPIFTNQHCTMNIYYGEKEAVLSIPRSAILGDFGNQFVFIRSGNHFEKLAVVTGRESADSVEIMQGLHPDDEVVIKGNYQLQYVTPEDPNASHDHDDDEKDTAPEAQHDHDDDEKAAE